MIWRKETYTPRQKYWPFLFNIKIYVIIFFDYYDFWPFILMFYECVTLSRTGTHAGLSNERIDDICNMIGTITIRQRLLYFFHERAQKLLHIARAVYLASRSHSTYIWHVKPNSHDFPIYGFAHNYNLLKTLWVNDRIQVAFHIYIYLEFTQHI